MTDKRNVGEQIFLSGFNCSQAVLYSFAGEMGLDKEVALKISSAFGAGMGRLQNTCGAVVGAFMVLGYMNGKYKLNDKKAKDKTYKLVQDFARDFEEINQSIKCRDLLECDLNTAEGMAEAREKDIFNIKCKKYVRDAIRLLERKYI